MTLDPLISAINDADAIALIAHVMPDGDTIGSCLALSKGLKSMGKKVDLYCQDSIPALYGFLDGSEQFKNEIETNAAYDLAIAVDCSDKQRMGCCCAIFDKSKVTACIDHHVSNKGFAQINYIDTKAAATGEIVYLLLSKTVSDISKSAADALYTALSTDTGSFAFSSTTSRTYRIAADTLDCGVDTDRITTALYKSNSLEKVKLLAKTLNTLSLYENNRVAVLVIKNDDIISTGAKDSDSESMVNYAKDVNGVELGMLIKEISPGSCKISFRSKDVIDVSELAFRFGGGGHKRASGASVQGDTETVKRLVLDEVHRLFKELTPI